MQKDYFSYEDYDVLKNWTSFFKPNPRESQLFKREFRGIDLAEKKLLDVGFGSGALLGWAMQQNAEVAGVEIQEKLLEIASNHGVKNFSDLSKVESNTYDVVTGFDVLEHIQIDEIQTFLDQVYRVAKPGAIVLLRFPNCQSPAGMICQFGDHTHVTMLSGPLVTFMMRRTGFIDVCYKGAQMISARTIINRVLRLILKPVTNLFELLYRLTVFDRDTPLTSNVIMIAKKP